MKHFDAFDAPPWAGFQTETPSGGANADKGLLGALISTFSVIIMGYLIGKFSWLPPPSTGMAQFMSRIALPSVVFAAMMTIDFGTLNWRLVLGLALSRTAVFAITVASSLAANRGDKLATAKAGIRGIFVTQSNDFALGLPLLASMYPTELTRYVYIAAPISFLWINPMGFALLEMGTRSSAAAAHGKKEGCGRVAWNIFKGVVSNPIVFMTFAGLVFNFIFKAAPPSVMLAPFEMLSKTFGGLALTALGMSMANKIFYLKGQAFVSAICLIFAKTILLPLLAKVIVSGLNPDTVYIASDAARALNINCTSAADEQRNPLECQSYDLSVFAFVYSTFPTAPGVLAFALQYGVDATEMAAGTVLCTIISAPLMFVTAKMAFIVQIEDVGNQTTGVQNTVEDVAQVFNLASNFGCLIVFVMYLLRGRYNRHLDVTVMMLALAMLSFNITSSLCPIGVPDTLLGHFHAGVIQYSWCAICVWVVVYLTVLEHMQAASSPGAGTDQGRRHRGGDGRSLPAGGGRGGSGGGWKRRFVVQHKHLIGWGLPVLFTGLIYGINSTRPDSSEGYTCWFHGIATSHPEMWMTNFAVTFSTFLALLFCSVKMQRRRAKETARTTRRNRRRAGNHRGEDEDTRSLSDASDDSLLGADTVGVVGSFGDRDDAMMVTPGSRSGDRAPSSLLRTQSSSLLLDDGTDSAGGRSSSGGGGGGTVAVASRGSGGDSINNGDGPDADVAGDDTELLTVPTSLRRDSSGSAAGSGGGGGGSISSELRSRMQSSNYLVPSDLRHSVFVTYEMCCMLLALVDPTLAVVRNDTTTRSGPIIELNFADVVLTSAQGVMLFLCFGVEDALWEPVTTALNRLSTSFRKRYYATESEELHRMRQWQSVHGDMTQVQRNCETLKEMSDVCMQELCRTRRYHLRTYKNVFTGKELIDFLLDKGVVEDRYVGLDFGRDLVIGDAIVHVSHEHHFHDCDFFYRLCTAADQEKKIRHSLIDEERSNLTA